MKLAALRLMAVPLAFALSFGPGLPARAAGFVNTKDGWMALTPEAKAAYVQGLNDSLNYVFADDTLANALAKKGRTECLIAQQTNSSLLADRITMAYQDSRFAGAAPTAIYIIKMGEQCRAYINKERASFGLGPI